MKALGNLILTLRRDEQFIIGDTIIVTLLGKRKVSIECPRELKIVKVVRKDFIEGECDDE